MINASKIHIGTTYHAGERVTPRPPPLRPTEVNMDRTTPYATSLRRRFFVYSEAMKHPHTNIILSLFNIPLVLKWAPKILKITGRGSSIGSEFAWHASGPEFDPHVRHIPSWRLGHENISTAILPLPLIQEEQLSVTGERMCTKYW